ncbi:MAG: hypothetical protein J4469_03335 [Candidatus Aenigmarchaeota archaeon]|nr:hypothetical protein [Candidatus Aenigmarchaeota archaeon]
MENKRNNKKLIYLAILIVAIAAAVGFLAYQKSEQNYQKAIQSELPDKCATPPGYTDEQWKEHMSHHPDMYERCL